MSFRHKHIHNSITKTVLQLNEGTSRQRSGKGAIRKRTSKRGLMTELDSVGSSENINFRGFPSFQQVCEKCSQATQKRCNVCKVMVLLYTNSKRFDVILLVCPVIKSKVLMLIKV